MWLFFFIFFSSNRLTLPHRKLCNLQVSCLDKQGVRNGRNATGDDKGENGIKF